MRQYLTLLGILLDSEPRPDRTNVGTRGIFGHQMRFEMSHGFPMLTTKALHFKSIAHELLWFLRGDTNVRYLQENGVRIWNEWADENGDLGPVYGHQWRKWPKFKLMESSGTPTWVALKVDQIEELVWGLKTNPFSRRHMVSAWNPADVPDMKLPPCHCLFQCYVRKAYSSERQATLEPTDPLALRSPEEWAALQKDLDDRGVPAYALDLQLYQRSADTFLGVPFNIASYSLLLHMLAKVVGMVPGTFVWTGGDVHLYESHVDQAHEQLSRVPKALPRLCITGEQQSIFDFKYEDFQLVGYNPDPNIPAKVAV